MSDAPRILVTGAAGKVGQAFIRVAARSPVRRVTVVRALCHNRKLPARARLEVVRGSIAAARGRRRGDGRRHARPAPGDLQGDARETIMDVAVKGLFWLLEACRTSPTFRQFILIGGDAGMGHFFYPHPIPVTETQKHCAYPGCYALSKVLEEVMLRAVLHPVRPERLLPARAVDHGEGRLQVPALVRRRRLRRPALARPGRRGQRRRVPRGGRRAGDARPRRQAGEAQLRPRRRSGRCDPARDRSSRRRASRRSTSAWTNRSTTASWARTWRRRAAPSRSPIKTPYHSTWLDNAKAKFLLGWRPRYDLKRMVDAAFGYRRAPDDPRKVWYPG